MRAEAGCSASTSAFGAGSPGRGRPMTSRHDHSREPSGTPGSGGSATGAGGTAGTPADSPQALSSASSSVATRCPMRSEFDMAAGRPVFQGAARSAGDRLMTAPELDKDLLAILACPETKEPVALAETALVARVNAAIEAGKVKSRDGQAVTRPMEA